MINLEDSPATKNQEILLFTESNKDFGISIEALHEIIPMVNIQELPSKDPYILGLINLRGNLLPVMTLNKQISSKKEYTSKHRIIIVKTEDSGFGILADDVQNIEYCTQSQIEKNDLLADRSPYILAGIKLDKGQTVYLINPQVLESRLRI